MRRFLLLLSVVLLLPACATRQPVPDAAPESVWLQHREDVRALARWQVQGRVAIRSSEEGWHANFDWQQADQQYRIRLRGPFGQGAVELGGGPGAAWLQRTGEVPVHAQDADALLVAETGWNLPVAGLSAWLRGVPDDARPARLWWDADGLLTQLEQDGWRIDFRRYRLVGQRQLPDKLQLERDNVRVKVVVDHWQAP